MKFCATIVVGVLLAASGVNAQQAQDNSKTEHNAQVGRPPTGPEGQLRLAPPATPPTPSTPSTPQAGGTIEALTLATALELAKQIGIEGAESAVNDDKTTSIFGQANGVPVEMSLGECDADCDASFTFYAKFGKQDNVDAVFANKFNVKNGTMLSVQDDGSLTLSYTMYLDGGVSEKHIVSVGQIFLAAIKSAIEFKP